MGEIEAFEPVAETQTHMLADSWFHCKRVCKAAQQLGWEFSGRLKSNRGMRLIGPDDRREWLARVKALLRKVRLDRTDFRRSLI